MFFAIAVAIIPLYTSAFYYCNVQKLDDESWTKKYGALYEGLQLSMEANKRKAALFFPFFFVIRRMAFMASVIWLGHFFWG